MRSVSRLVWAFVAAAVVSSTVSAADARPRHTAHRRVAAVVHAPAYAAYGAARGHAEEFNGTSVPYDPDGPGWNDFQLQGSD